MRGADIVVTATWSKDPVLEAAWISPGTHINAMGSNQAQRRELPSDLIARADLIAVDSIEVAKIESGDLLLAPVDWTDPRIVELAQVEAAPARGSGHDFQIQWFGGRGRGGRRLRLRTAILKG